MNYARNPPVRPPPHPFKVDYRIMDVTKMTYPDRSVDCVIDKATLDTMKQLDDDDDDARVENFDPGATKRAPARRPRIARGEDAPRSVSRPQTRRALRLRHVRRTRDATLALRSDVKRRAAGSGRTRFTGGEDGDGEPCLELKRNRATYYVYAFRKRTDASLVAERVVNELVEESVASGQRVFPS